MVYDKHPVISFYFSINGINGHVGFTGFGLFSHQVHAAR